MGLLQGRLASSELINLAQEKTVSARKQLVENVTDLFLSPEGRLSEHERALMNDILFKLIKNVEKSVKKELSARLATMTDTSPELASFLANDAIDVAEPMLRKSAVLADEQLIEIVRERSDAHRMAIAIRAHVSEEVSDEIIENGAEDVVEALIKNQNAEISEASMKYLVAESKNVDRFQEPLLNRHDLPADLALRMYWWVSAALRRKIILDFKMDGVLLDDAMEMATKKAIQHSDTSDGVMKLARNLARSLASENKLDVTFLLKCLRQEKVNLFVAAISELTGLDDKIIWRAMRERTGESIAIIAKSLEFDRDKFASLFLLLVQSRSGGKARATSLVNSILKLYDEINLKNAKVAVRHWQRDFCYQNALLVVKDAV